MFIKGLLMCVTKVLAEALTASYLVHITHESFANSCDPTHPKGGAGGVMGGGGGVWGWGGVGADRGPGGSNWGVTPN